MEKNGKIFVFLTILSIIAIFLSQKNTYKDTVTIVSDGKIAAELPLCEDTEISVKGKNTVKIENGSVYVSDADCPDKLCVKQGKIGKSGGTIVCLPNKLTVEVKEGKK